MITQNIRNEVYLAVEEYNKTIKRPHHRVITDDERAGIFYTILRRHIPMGLHRSRVKADDFRYQFHPSGELKLFRLKRDLSNMWTKDIESLKALKELTYEKPEFFSTPAMNEIADIINSIK